MTVRVDVPVVLLSLENVAGQDCLIPERKSHHQSKASFILVPNHAQQCYQQLSLLSLFYSKQRIAEMILNT